MVYLWSFCSRFLPELVLLLLSFFVDLSISARSFVGPNDAYSEVGPRDVPPACSVEHGFPVREDCLQALDYMIEDVVPVGYEWQRLSSLGNVHNPFGIQAREFRAAGDRRPRRFPDYEKVELPMAWASGQRKGSCLVAVRLKSANWHADLSNWSDIITDRLPLINDNCVTSARGQGTGGTSLTGEHNGVKLEIYGLGSTLKQYSILRTMCGLHPTALSPRTHSCNTRISALEGATNALTQVLGSLWQGGGGAGPFAGWRCRPNTYTLDARAICEGFMYEVIDMGGKEEGRKKGLLEVLFGIREREAWTKIEAMFLLVTAEGWKDGGLDEFVPSGLRRKVRL